MNDLHSCTYLFLCTAFCHCAHCKSAMCSAAEIPTHTPAVKSFFLLQEPSSVLTSSPWIHCQSKCDATSIFFLSSNHLTPVQGHRGGEETLFPLTAFLVAFFICLLYSLPLPLHGVILILIKATFHVSHKDLHQVWKYVHLRVLFAFMHPVPRGRPRSGWEKKKEMCESVKSRQPTGLSLKESCDKAVGGEGSWGGYSEGY